MKIARKIAVNIGRLLLAATFIFSGFVKGIDPLGTQYKITDYLEALHIDWMFPSWSTLVMSVLLAMCEFAIGIFLLFAIRRKLVSKITLLVMAVMTLITLWIVIADPVKDCGCFGDAIVLSNMETFIKNIILLAIAILLWRRPMDMPLLISKPTRWIVINYTFLFSIVMSTWSLWYLPQFDFRPYHIGANIAKGMEIPKGAKQPKFDTTFILEKNGERIRLTQVEYAILKLFMQNPGRALSREDILSAVWGKDYEGELKIVDVNIRRLRIKIEDDTANPTYITTVWGLGYKWGA